MLNQFSRTELLFGEKAMKYLKQCRVAVFGIGGVGGYAVEALARTGIGTLDLIDNDKICLTNLNRQIFATHSTIGKYKIDVAEARIYDICSDIKINKYPCFYLPETADNFDFTQYDYIIDAIDTMTGKIEIIMRANQANIPVISCMGAGNKLDPTAFKIADIYQTKVCPLARTMRHELKKRGIKNLKVVYSEEQPVKIINNLENSDTRRSIPASNAFVPSVAGLILAGEVIKDLVKLA
ncbi:MAG: tRNA threonylcarbamoyladenosine dehydratase [Oscillospiraceae bacterium]|nr:tRNA threonylcarbamoyladenosine dehydratase [Oscillospiraceae bacterium]